MSKIEKNIKIDESIYLMYNSLSSLYSYYKPLLPKELAEKLYSLRGMTLIANDSDFEKAYTKEYLGEDYDLVDIELYEHVIFDDNDKQ